MITQVKHTGCVRTFSLKSPPLPSYQTCTCTCRFLLQYSLMQWPHLSTNVIHFCLINWNTQHFSNINPRILTVHKVYFLGKSCFWMATYMSYVPNMLILLLIEHLHFSLYSISSHPAGLLCLPPSSSNKMSQHFHPTTFKFSYMSSTDIPNLCSIGETWSYTCIQQLSFVLHFIKFSNCFWYT